MYDVPTTYNNGCVGVCECVCVRCVHVQDHVWLSIFYIVSVAMCGRYTQPVIFARDVAMSVFLSGDIPFTFCILCLRNFRLKFICICINNYEH